MMFRQRARPEVPDLDRDTAERLLDGASADDLPDSYRRVAELLAAASRPATPGELRGAAVAAAEFVAAHDSANRPRKRRVRPVVAIAVGAVLVAASAGTAVAADEGALPQPVQAVAHDALGVVGISVPGITPEHDAPTKKVDTPSGGSVDSVNSVDSVDHGGGSHGAKAPTGATSHGVVTSAPPAGTDGTVSPATPTHAPAVGGGQGAGGPQTPESPRTTAPGGSPATTAPGGQNGNGNGNNGNGNNGNGNNGNGGNSADHRQNANGS